MNRTDGPGAFTLGTAFPRRVFTADDYERPLDSLGERDGAQRWRAAVETGGGHSVSWGAGVGDT